MSQINPFLSSLNSGEFSPRMEARVDFERYPNASKMCRNFVLLPQGGITRRPGTRFIKEVKTSSLSTRLIPFQFSEDDSYMLEAGNAYFRFYRRQGRLAVEDTDAAVTNGTFASNITGWTDASTGGAAIAHDATNQRMQLTGASGGVAWARQGVTISAGNTAKEHVLRFKVAVDGGGTIGFQVGTSTTGSEILSEVKLGAGFHSIAFTPNATTFYIQFRNNITPVRNAFIDDVVFLDNEPLELTSPYATADLTDLRYFQAGDVVYICHQSYAVRKIERRGHRSWSIVEAFFEDGPYLETNDGTDLNDAQIITNPLFDNGIIGWTDNSTGSAAFVLHNNDGKHAELDPGASGSAQTAVMRTSTTVVSGKKFVVHVLILSAGAVTVNLGSSAGGTQYSTASQQPGWASYEFTTSGTTLHVEFRYAGYGKGRAGVGGCQAYSEDARLLEPSATTGSVTLTALGFAPFTASDVGRLIRLEWPGQEPGYGVITAYTSTTVVTLLVLRDLAATTPTESWRMGAFGGSQGYPKVVAFFDGRFVVGNTTGKPNTVWLSQSGSLQNMRPDSFEDGASTVEDDDAISVTLRSTQINPIHWISAASGKLMIGTAGGQWVVQSAGATVSPSDISAKQHSAVPVADMSNIEINQTILFADRARREVHDLGFSLQEDSFLATDLTILSDHIFRSRLEEMVYQRNPFSTVWCRRADGRLVSLSYNRQHQILGWSQTIIGGVFGSGNAVVESIACIPGADDSNQTYTSDERNELWMIVKRTINGSTKRYIEVMEYFFDGVLREDYSTENAWKNAMREEQEDAFYVDSGLTYSGSATTTVTGLDHLEGQTVNVLADGIAQPTKVVSGGAISINTPATKIHVGLVYTHKYEGLKLAAATQAGAGVGKVKIVTAIGVVLLDSSEFKMTTTEYDEHGRRVHDLYTIRFQQEHEDPDVAVPLFTGETIQSAEGAFSRDARLYMEGDKPLPITVLGLAPQMEIRAE